MNALLRAAQPTLRLSSVEVGTPTSPSGRQETVVATLEAEPRGLWAWTRRVLGFGRSVSLMITTSRVIKMTRGRKEEYSDSIPLSALARIHYDYSKPATMFIVGQLLAMFGLVGIFVISPQMVVSLLVGAGIIAMHYLTGPKFTVHFSGKDLGHLTVKVESRHSTKRLIQFADAAAEQLRVAEQAPTARPTWSQPSFSARA